MAPDKKQRSPIGTKVPREAIDVAEVLASKVWELARRNSVAIKALAESIGNKPTSSSFQQKVALLRYYGLVEGDKDNIQLTAIGIAIVRTDDEQVRATARRDAFMAQKHFAEVIAGYGGGQLPDTEKLATTFKFKYALSDEAATSVANAFRKSAEQAGLVDANGVVSSDVTAPADIDGGGPPPQPAYQPPPAPNDTSQNGDTNTKDDPPPPPPPTPPAPRVDPPPAPASSAVSLNLTLDLSSFAADDVVRVLRALGLARSDEPQA